MGIVKSTKSDRLELSSWKTDHAASCVSWKAQTTSAQVMEKIRRYKDFGKI